ncbi:sigma-70 region 4 domain-containing protein [Aquimarina algicola]|uniref:HTH luxR-type domain-containing protein n=1 Tax=Aquimarina algicola TaxID=2589995 RepID=A0A504IY37_9FLAO|nr:sigma-70 region 4 domain-containing protein [Aquimarina algicola]TPN83366.1 hypothetical protein FHK87_19280 [Aquimarina algicola]
MKFYYSLLMLFFIGFNLIAQQEPPKSIISKIDSLQNEHKYDTTSLGLSFHHRLIQKSIKANYINGTLISYLNLIWLHGTKHRLDSVLHYSNQFEQLEKHNPNQELKYSFLINNGTIFTSFFGLAEPSLNSLFEAYKLVDENDKAKIINLKSKIAYVYIQKEQYDLAIQTITESINDTVSLGINQRNELLSHFSMAYQYKEMPKKSTPLLSQMIKESKNAGNRVGVLYAKLFQTYNYYLEKEYQKSIDSGLKVRQELKTTYPDLLPTNSEFLAIYYNAIGNTKEAIFYMKEAIATSNITNELPKLYKDLADYYKKENRLDSALYYLKKERKIMDSIRNMEKEIFTDYYNTKISFINQSHENDKISLEKKILTNDRKLLSIQSKKQQLYIFTLLAALALLILIFIIYRRDIKTKQKIDALEKSREQLLKNQLEMKEHELSVFLITQATQIEKLTKIKNTLFKSIKENDTKGIQNSKKQFSNFLKSSESIDFITERLESQYPKICYILQRKHPELSKNDIKHCILVKLGLSLKESASLLNVTISAVKVARHRAKSKMNIPENVSLQDFLNDMDITK